MTRTCQSLLLASFIVFSPIAEAASTSWGENYAELVRGRELLAPLTDSSFGDDVALYDGATRFSVTDVSLPGNNALPVALSRSWDPQDQGLSQQVVGDWVVDVPNISGVFVGDNGWPDKRCSEATFPPTITYSGPPNYLVLSPHNYFNGYSLEVPGGQGGLLLIKTDDPKAVAPSAALGGAAWSTKNNWHFACLASVRRGSGEAFVGLSPDGKRYTFDWMVADHQRPMYKRGAANEFFFRIPRSRVRIYATKVEDRFGNTVSYEWAADRLKRIYSSDGREISLNYDDNGRLSTVVANGKTWFYRYKAYSIVQEDPFYLSEVELPGGAKWTYDASGFVRRILYRKGNIADMRDGDGYLLADTVYCNWDRVIIGGGGVYSVTQPSGAKASYTFTPMRHGRKNVKERCIDGRDTAKGGTNHFPLQHDVLSLTSKVITGAGMKQLAYTYAFEGRDPGYAVTSLDPSWNAQVNATPVPNYKTVTVSEPGGNQQIYVFGRDAGVNEGRLFAQETRRAGSVVRKVAYEYVSDAEVGSMPFPASAGQSSGASDRDLMFAYNRPVKRTSITQDGDEFITTINAFDAFARPVSITKSSSAVGTTPQPPSPVEPTAPVSPGKYVVSWAAVAGSDHYVVEQRMSNGEWVEVYRGGATQWTARLSGPAVYGFRVKSCSFYGDCALSPPISVAVKGVDITPILMNLLLN